MMFHFILQSLTLRSSTSVPFLWSHKFNWLSFNMSRFHSHLTSLTAFLLHHISLLYTHCIPLVSLQLLQPTLMPRFFLSYIHWHRPVFFVLTILDYHNLLIASFVANCDNFIVCDVSHFYWIDYYYYCSYYYHSYGVEYFSDNLLCFYGLFSFEFVYCIFFPCISSDVHPALWSVLSHWCELSN